MTTWDRIRIEAVALKLCEEQGSRNAIVYVDGVQVIVQEGRVLSDMEADELVIAGRDVGAHWKMFHANSEGSSDDDW